MKKDDERTAAALNDCSENYFSLVKDAIITSNTLITTEAIYYCSQVIDYHEFQIYCLIILVSS